MSIEHEPGLQNKDTGLEIADNQGLRRKTPIRKDSATSIPLNDTRALLPPEELARLDAALDSLARERQTPPPDIGVN
jgi:hypothetical protein